MPTKNWYHAAGRVWPVLIDAATRRTTVTYKEVAPTIPTNPLSVGKALGPIQDYCLANRLPPLTAIVVQKHSGVPGTGFVAWDVDDLESANRAVYGFNWATVTNPYGEFDETDTPDSLADVLVASPEKAAEVYTKVRVRGIAQQVFRTALRKAYGDKCSFCRLSFPAALEAAHIVPWEKASASQRLDPRNGLLLCSTHHKLFDAAAITVSESLRIVYYDAQMKNGPYTATDKVLSIDLHDTVPHLPSQHALRPSAELLAKHHIEKKWGKLP